MDLKFLRCAGEGAYRANLAKKITETQTLKLGGAMGRSRKGKLECGEDGGQAKQN